MSTAAVQLAIFVTVVINLLDSFSRTAQLDNNERVLKQFFVDERNLIACSQDLAHAQNLAASMQFFSAYLPNYKEEHRMAHFHLMQIEEKIEASLCESKNLQGFVPGVAFEKNKTLPKEFPNLVRRLHAEGS